MKYLKMLGLAALTLGVAAGVAHATVPAEITSLTTDANTVWSTVKDFKVGIIAFTLLVWVILKIRR